MVPITYACMSTAQSEVAVAFESPHIALQVRLREYVTRCLENSESKRKFGVMASIVSIIQTVGLLDLGEHLQIYTFANWLGLCSVWGLSKIKARSPRIIPACISYICSIKFINTFTSSASLDDTIIGMRSSFN